MAPDIKDRAPAAELERRSAEVVKRFGERELDALLVSGIGAPASSGHLRYLTNWAQPFAGEYYLLSNTGEKVFLARTQERAHLVKELFGLQARVGATAAGVTAELRRLGARRVGISGLATMTAAFYEALRREASDVDLIDATEILDGLRMVKSAAELALVARSAGLGDLAFAAFTERAAEGVTERAVFTELDHLVRRHGAEDTYFMMASDPAPVPKFMDLAWATYRRGDVVLFNAEIAGPGGYYTQLVRTGTVGPATHAVLGAFTVCRRALEAGEKLLGPGIPLSEVFEASEATITGAGYRRGLHLGHSQGLDIFEKPLVSASDRTVLEPGMVIVLHPHVELPAGGGVWIGETFRITDAGSERFHSSSRELFVV